MKKKSTSKSAFFNFRVLIGLFVFLNQQQSPDNDEVENPSGGALNRSRLYRIDIFRPHYSCRGKFVELGK